MSLSRPPYSLFLRGWLIKNLLKRIPEKKRGERSSSGESSTSSDAKKAKSRDFNFPEVEEHEADNEIFTALNKAGT